MKHKTIAAAATLALIFPSLAFAQDGQEDRGRGIMGIPVKVMREVKDRIALQADFRASSTEGRLEMKAKVEERMEDRRDDRKASSTERRIEVKQKITKFMAEHAAKMFSATVERLEKIMARLESRIAKVKAEGSTTTASEGFVASAKVELSSAKAEIAAFSAIDITTASSTDKLRTAGASIKEHLRKAHQFLAQGVAALKPGANKLRATTTVEVDQ